MKRRTFLNASMWSVLGCTVLPGVAIARPGASTNSGIQDLFDMLGFRSQNIFSIEESLFQLGEEHLTPWLKLGYTPLDNCLFWKAGADCAVLPVQLLHAKLGLLESCTIHFAKSPDGIWEYCGSLSGFQLEAIQKACVDMAMQDTDAAYHRQLLLPIASASLDTVEKSAYITALGSFELKVKISSDQTLIRARLNKADKMVWEGEYLSDHLRKGETQRLMS